MEERNMKREQILEMMNGPLSEEVPEEAMQFIYALEDFDAFFVFMCE